MNTEIPISIRKNPRMVFVVFLDFGRILRIRFFVFSFLLFLCIFSFISANAAVNLT